MSKLYLAIDIGTTNVKIALFDINGNMSDFFQERQVGKNMNGNSEINPKLWWNSFKEIINRVPENKRKRIHSLSITGQGPTIIGIRENGEVSLNAITWLDSRGEEYQTKLIKKGLDPQFASVISKLQCVKDNVGYKNYLIQPADYIAFKLTGRIINMSFKQFGYLPWNKDLIEKEELNEHFVVPELVESSKTVGPIRKTVAEELSLPNNIKVVSGSPDFAAGLVGTGTVRKGFLCDRGGTSQGVTLCSDIKKDIKGLITTPYFLNDLWKISGIMKTSGRALDWFTEEVLHTQIKDLRNLESVKRPTGIIFLPYLSGERSPYWNPDAKGIFFGLNLDSNREDIFISIMEGISFSIRDIIERMEESKLKINKIRMTGGQTQSEVFNQLKADVLGRELELPDISESELLGTAIYAIANDSKEDISQTANRLVSIEKVYEPDMKMYKKYTNLFKVYRNLYDRNKDLFMEIIK